MTAFEGPLTSPSYSQAAHGILKDDALLLYTDNNGNISALLANIDVSSYFSVGHGPVQQGLQWDIVLLANPSSTLDDSPRFATPSAAASASRLNFSKLRRKSSLGGSHALPNTSSPLASLNTSGATYSSSPPSASSSKTSAWLKSKLRSKSISTSASSSSSLSAQLRQHEEALPLPAIAQAPSEALGHRSDTRRPSTASELSSSTSSTSKSIKSSGALILSTINKDLRDAWLHALSQAIPTSSGNAHGVPAKSILQKSSASDGRMSTSSSLPSLSIHTSPSANSTQYAELASYNFPRKPPPSPLRVAAIKSGEAGYRPALDTASTSSSFLELDPPSPASSAPGSRRGSAAHGHGSDSAITPKGSMAILADSRRSSTSMNPLLPQWLSDVRRNSTGSTCPVSPVYGYGVPTDGSERSGGPLRPLTPSSSRPGMRPSKSSSYLHTEPSQELFTTKAMLHSEVLNSESRPPSRGIKISIHPDESSNSEPVDAFDTTECESTTAEVGEEGVGNMTTDLRAHRMLSATSLSSSARRRAMRSTSPETPQRVPSSQSMTRGFLRPSGSSASLSSVAASSLCGGGESVSSIAPSNDPPTPCPDFVETLAPAPNSCELTPTSPPVGKNKQKLQNYFGLPEDVAASPEIAGKHKALPLVPSTGKQHKSKKEEKKTKSPKTPLHARLGSVFSSSSAKASRLSGSTGRLSEDRVSIKSNGSISGSSISVSQSSYGRFTKSRHSGSAASSVAGRTCASSKSSCNGFGVPTASTDADVGRHIIDPAELRRLMQERLAPKATPRTSYNYGRRGTVMGAAGLPVSMSIGSALDAYADASPAPMRDETAALSSSTNSVPLVAGKHKHTFGKGHTAQVCRTPSPVPAVSVSGSSASEELHESKRVPVRSESATNLNVQALFAALPPPRRRSGTTVTSPPPKAAANSLPPLPAVPEAVRGTAEGI